MLVGAKNSRTTRPLGALSALGATVVLLSFGPLLPHAAAQDKTDKPDDTKTTKIDKTNPTDPSLAAGIGSGDIDPNQPLKPNFLITVSVVGEPEPSGDYLVDESGNVAIRYGGITTPVAVKGMSPSQTAAAVAKLLKAYLGDPKVTVSIKAIPRPYVYVRGAVAYTGPIVIGNDTTLADVLGKLTPLSNADLTHIFVVHKGAKEASEYNYDKYLSATTVKDLNEQNPLLKAGDAILVPKRKDSGPLQTTTNGGVITGPITSISVTGSVARPMNNLPVRSENQTMTLKEAISLVGGITSDANRHIVTVRHASNPDRPVVYDLEKAEQGDTSQNPELQPNDTVFVDKLQINAYVNVNGGVVKTGKYPYESRITLTQIVEDAGGIAPYAKDKDGRIFRHPDNEAAHTQVIKFNWKDIAGGKARDIDLQPGDSVQVTPGGPSTAPNIFSVISGLSSLSYLLRGGGRGYY